MTAFCARCVQAAEKGGICETCRADVETRRKALLGDSALIQSEFVKVLQKNRDKQPYDCVFPLSGGKESATALRNVKEKFSAKPLSILFNHGFLSERTIVSARRSADGLAVDFIYFQTVFLKDLLRIARQAGARGVIAPVYGLWHLLKTLEIASQFGVQIVVAPDSPAELDEAAQEFIAKHLRADPKYKEFPRSLAEALKIAKSQYGTKALVVAQQTIAPAAVETEEAPDEGSQLAREAAGITAELSVLIRKGLLTRDEAVEIAGAGA